jgi:hypothetical protein
MRKMLRIVLVFAALGAASADAQMLETIVNDRPPGSAPSAPGSSCTVANVSSIAANVSSIAMNVSCQ